MAVVNLRTVWFNAYGNEADSLELSSASSLTRTDSVNGSMQTTGTRIRWVEDDSPQVRNWSVSCDLATADERAWLRAHIGVPGVWVRDHLGQRVYGVFASVSDTPEVWDDVSPLTIGIMGLTPDVT